MADLYRQSMLQPVPLNLRDRLEAELLPIAAQSVSFKDVMFGVPIENMVTGLMYNQHVVDMHGIGEIPDNWSEFITMARRVAQVGEDGLLTYPALTTLGANWSLGFMFISMLLAEGSDVINEKGQLNLYTQEAVKVLERFSNMMVERPIMDFYSWDAFHQGNVAFAMGWPFSAQWTYDVKQYGSLPIPQGDAGYAAMQYGHAYGVPVNTENAAEAWRLLEYLATEIGKEQVTPIGHAMSILGSLPVNTKDLQAPVFTDAHGFLSGFCEASLYANSIMSYNEVGITGEWRFGDLVLDVVFRSASPHQVLEDLEAVLRLDMQEFRESFQL
ncbi:MAG: extracellular solute-binding protein [Limnochordia bacterium]|nr:extracellular solute-binding protein [Limnochordia bacterium]